jgi:hypothetical protein
MKNPLIEVVELEFNRHSISTARLVYESYNPKNFGNAEAVYELNNLHLRFLRNRDDETVSIGSSSRPHYFYNLDDVAVWMGWISLDALLRHDTPINFDEPPPGPIFSLAKALSLIARDLTQINKAFSSDELLTTHEKLKEVERMRLAA